MPRRDLPDTFPKARSIPNDLEFLFLYYPRKFPPIVQQYRDSIRRFQGRPDALRRFCLKQQKELFLGLERIIRDFEKIKNPTLEQLVKIDLRLQKLFCYRFWMVNYGLCDGPFHSHYVEKIRHYARVLAEWDEPAVEEPAVERIENILLKSDYADLYLRNAFLGNDFCDLCKKDAELGNPWLKIKEKIGKNRPAYPEMDGFLQGLDAKRNTPAVRAFLARHPQFATLKQVKGSKGMYGLLVHSIEFESENRELAKTVDRNRITIEEIFQSAKTTLSKKEFSDFKTSCQMVRTLLEAKDIYGDADPILLPFWFGKIQRRLAEKTGYRSHPKIGHGLIFSSLAWHLPDELKAEVFTPDYQAFELRKL